MARSSSGKPTATINDIPQELLDLVCESADVSSLKALFLGNKALYDYAVKALFARVVVRGNDESAQKWIQGVCQSYKKLVRSAAFIPIASFRPLRDPYTVNFLPNSFYTALMQIRFLENLRSIEIRFDEDTVVEDSDIRDRTIEHLGVGFRSFPEGPRNVRSLLIDNLWKHEYEFDRTLIAGLEAISLRIADVPWSMPDDPPDWIHNFYNSKLEENFLSPIAHQLQELKLYGNQTYWGHYPRCDLHTLRFPQLKTLCLGQYAFASDSQLDWILDHGETLEVLVLEDCPILFEGMDPTHGYAYAQPQPHTIDARTGNMCWKYDGRWHTCKKSSKSR